MDLDEPMYRYFGTTELSAVAPDLMASGRKGMVSEFSLISDRRRRFATWALMHVLGIAPDADSAFDHAADRKAARDFVGMLASVNDN